MVASAEEMLVGCPDQPISERFPPECCCAPERGLHPTHDPTLRIHRPGLARDTLVSMGAARFPANPSPERRGCATVMPGLTRGRFHVL